MTLPKDFNISHQWELFLQRCQVNEKTMPEDQRREMKRAFFGACGQMLILLRDELGDYSDKYGDESTVHVLSNMLDQVSVFWETEMQKQSGKAN